MLSIGIEGYDKPRVLPHGVGQSRTQCSPKPAVDGMCQHVDTVGACYLLRPVTGAVVDDDYLRPSEVAEEVIENRADGLLLVIRWNDNVRAQKILEEVFELPHCRNFEVGLCLNGEAHSAGLVGGHHNGERPEFPSGEDVIAVVADDEGLRGLHVEPPKDSCQLSGIGLELPRWNVIPCCDDVKVSLYPVHFKGLERGLS